MVVANKSRIEPYFALGQPQQGTGDSGSERKSDNDTLLWGNQSKVQTDDVVTNKSRLGGVIKNRDDVTSEVNSLITSPHSSRELVALAHTR